MLNTYLKYIQGGILIMNITAWNQYVFYPLVLFTIGGSIASFVGTSVKAYKMNRSNLTRSTCWKCDHTLNVIDLLPVWGYLIRKGKCHYCGEKFSSTYLIYELLVGVGALTITLDTLYGFLVFLITILGIIAYECKQL